MARMQARTRARDPRGRTGRRPTFDPYDPGRRPGVEYAWLPVFETGLNTPPRWRFRWVHESEIDGEQTVKS